MARIQISNDPSGRKIVSFPYDPLLVTKVKTILRYIQEILGHQHSKTTEIYTHVSTKSIIRIKSPLDNLNLKKGGDV